MWVTGNVSADLKTESVHGLVWMDHEFMTNALTSNQQGWDWFSLSLKDGRHLMLFVLRDKQGGIDYASGTIIDAQQTSLLSAEDFQVKVLDHWKSPHSQARYPARWKISVPQIDFSAVLTPRSPAQELHWGSTSSSDSAANRTAISYWEGAISDESQSVIGYAELTGYAGDMGDVL
jgi:predicted secreted hydrolase